MDSHGFSHSVTLPSTICSGESMGSVLYKTRKKHKVCLKKASKQKNGLLLAGCLSFLQF